MKLFNKIAIVALGAAMAIGVGTSVALNNSAKVVKGETSTYNFSSVPTSGWSAKGGSVTINKIAWTYSSATYISYSSSKLQVGSKNNPQTSDWTMSTPISSFGENVTVTAVSITAYTTATSATYDISVGGTSAKADSLTTSSTTYTANGLTATDGDIVITLKGSSTSKAMYLSNIGVAYEVSTTPVTPEVKSVTVTPETATIKVGKTTELTATVSVTGGAAQTVTWASDDESVATVDNGVVTGVSVGEATITATSTADGTKSDSCVVTVEEAPATTEFKHFTSTLLDGEYIITSTNFSNILANSITSNRADNYSGDDAELSGESIFTSDGSIVWQISKSGSYWLIYNAEVGKYLGGTSAKNQAALLDSAVDLAKWTCSVTDGEFDFVNYGRSIASSDPNNKYLRSNGTSGFATYASGTGTKIALFKKEGATPTKTVTAVTGATSSVSRIVKGESIEGNLVSLDVTYDDLSTGTVLADHVTINSSVVGTGITATAWYSADETNGLCATFIVEVISTMQNAYEIAIAKGKDQVTFEGTCIGTAGSNAFIQDGNYGILVYKANHGITLGKHVTVTSTLKLYNGIPETDSIPADGIVIGADDTPIVAQEIESASEVSSRNLNTLVSTPTVTASSSVTTYSGSSDVTLSVKLNEESFNVFFDKNAYSSELGEIVNSISANDEIALTNVVVSTYNTNRQLRITKDSTVEVVSSKTLESISAIVSSLTRYSGDKLSASDFTVTGTYSDTSTAPISSGFTWTVNGVEDGALVEGDNAIVVTYSGVSSSSINVVAVKAEKQTLSITVADIVERDTLDGSGGTPYKELILNDFITATATGGGNTGKIYSNEQWRIYQGESPEVTISLDEGYSLVSVKITYAVNNNGCLVYNEQKISSGTVVNASGSSLTFTIGNTGSASNGQVRVTAFEICYLSSGDDELTAVSVSAEIRTMAGGWENPVATSSCAANYAAAKALVVKLSASELAIFQNDTENNDIVMARTTYIHWCQVNGDDNYYEGDPVTASKNLKVFDEGSSSTVIVGTVVLLTVFSLAAAFYIRKKKFSE